MNEPRFKFRPGDKVEKLQGYHYPGVVVAAFHVPSNGKERVVVEADHPNFLGMLHIFSPEQLTARK